MANSSDEDLNSDNEIIDLKPLWRDRPFLSDSSTTTEEEEEKVLAEVSSTNDSVELSPGATPLTAMPTISTPLPLSPSSRDDRDALESLMAEINDVNMNVSAGRAERQRLINQFVPSNVHTPSPNIGPMFYPPQNWNEMSPARRALIFEEHISMYENSIYNDEISFEPLPDRHNRRISESVPERRPVRAPTRIPRGPFERLPRRLSQLRNSRNSSIDTPRPIRGRTFISPPRYAHGRQNITRVIPTFSRLIDPPGPLDDDDNSPSISRLTDSPQMFLNDGLRFGNDTPLPDMSLQTPRAFQMSPIPHTRPISRIRSIPQAGSTSQPRTIPRGSIISHAIPRGTIISQARPIPRSRSTPQTRSISQGRPIRRAPALPQLEDDMFEDTPPEIEDTMFVLPAALREKEKESELDDATRATRAELVTELLMSSPKASTSSSDPKKPNSSGKKEDDPNKKHKK